MPHTLRYTLLSVREMFTSAGPLALSRIVPPLYEFRIRSRVFRWYGQLRDIEDRANRDGLRPELLNELDRLETRVEKITVSLSYTDELNALRNHIELVRQKLKT